MADPRSLEFSVAYWHEMMHWNLAPALVDQAVRAATMEMWTEISNLTDPEFTPEHSLMVPLIPLADGAPIQRAWHKIITLARRSQVIHEIFAVWGSFAHVRQMKRFQDADIERIEGDTVKIYSAAYRGFREMYADFCAVANRLDYETARAVIFGPLHSADWQSGLLESMVIVKERLERGDSVVGEELLEDYVCRRPRDISELSELLRGLSVNLEDSYTGIPSPVPMLCVFDRSGIDLMFSPDQMAAAKSFALSEPDFEYDWQQARAQRMFELFDQFPKMLWNESIRQQLTQGDGIRCPFWQGHGCCGQIECLSSLAERCKPDDSVQQTWALAGCLAV